MTTRPGDIVRINRHTKWRVDEETVESVDDVIAGLPAYGVVTPDKPDLHPDHVCVFVLGDHEYGPVTGSPLEVLPDSVVLIYRPTDSDDGMADVDDQSPGHANPAAGGAGQSPGSYEDESTTDPDAAFDERVEAALARIQYRRNQEFLRRQAASGFVFTPSPNPHYLYL